MTLAAQSDGGLPNLWIRRGLILGFAPILIAVLGVDSVNLADHGYRTQWLADWMAIAYFTVMLWGLKAEERRIAIIFVPFSALAEYLFSQVFDLYLYRLDMVPLYVPFGHAILFSTGLVLADLKALQQWNMLRWILLGVHLMLFLLAIALWHDGLSAILLLIFAWVLQRKGARLLYGIMGCLVLMVELSGTSLGCWTWQSESFGWLHTTNPPVGAFVFYVLGDLAGFKLGRWVRFPAFVRSLENPSQ
ncbi:MAG: hypothetical protein F6K30_01070 [Cyanothece sp. SIO2G6]|nr:hypothetical protein [Cyanothece sp. SIO2G6]